MLLLPWNRIFSKSKWLHKTLESLDFISKKPLRNNMSERGYYTNPLRVARYNISVPHRTLAPQRDPGHPNSHWDAPPSTKIYTSFGLIYIFHGRTIHTTHNMLIFFEQPEIILGRYQHSKPHMFLWGTPRLTPADPSAHQEHPEFQPKHLVRSGRFWLCVFLQGFCWGESLNHQWFDIRWFLGK